MKTPMVAWKELGAKLEERMRAAAAQQQDDAKKPGVASAKEPRPEATDVRVKAAPDENPFAARAGGRGVKRCGRAFVLRAAIGAKFISEASNAHRPAPKPSQIKFAPTW